jgi:hypothetical protein
MEEIWKDVVGYEGIYEVSSLGKIRTKEGKTTHSIRHGNRIWEQRILKQKQDKSKYFRVELWKDKVHTTHLVHRLIAKAFLDKEERFNIINHKDGDSSNNNVDNLEWCDYKINNNHARRNGLNNIAFKPTKLIRIADGVELNFDTKMETVRYLGKAKGYLTRKIKRDIIFDIYGNAYHYNSEGDSF